jgi:large subunit ribosomal protein L21
MYAIVDHHGKQYRLEAGRYLDVDLLDMPVDGAVEFPNVLLLVDGEKTLLGQPYVAGAKVTAKVMNHRKGPKIIVYKMRCKKGYRLKQGHRQHYSRIQIETITA